MDRAILHCDCNGFYASVECIQRPELWTVPMAVCGDPENRHGVILAKNELAKSFGVITAETVWMARKKCPDLVLVPPHHSLYHAYSRRINEIYGRYTDQVEAFSVDESWLDVTGSRKLSGSGRQIADELRRTIQQQLGLTISVGVSFNKIFAKLGSDYKKPNATTEITRENYRSILFPLPVRDMIFVGKSTAVSLERLGIYTIGQLAEADRTQLENQLGKLGAVLWDYANGLDDSPVQVQGAEEAAKSISNSITFRRNLEGLEDIRQGLLMLVDSVATRLRSQGLRCQTLAVSIKDPSLKVISRQRTLPYAVNQTQLLYRTALDIVRESWNLKAPIRLLSVAATGLTARAAIKQTDLFGDIGDHDERRQRLDQAVDAIRRRFGEGSLQYATLLDTDIVSGDPHEPVEKQDHVDET